MSKAKNLALKIVSIHYLCKFNVNIFDFTFKKRKFFRFFEKIPKKLTILAARFAR